MKVLLVRHGNTFESWQPALWVGSKSDMHLTNAGREQARSIGSYLRKNQLKIDRIYSGPLFRTKETSEEISSIIGYDRNDISIMQELKELDYGTWEGKSTEEIIEEFGSADIDAWQNKSIWPTGYQWAPSEELVVEHWRKFEQKMKSDTAGGVMLVVSSNGIFRLISKMMKLGSDNIKMSTGRISSLEITNESYKLDFWNLKP